MPSLAVTVRKLHDTNRTGWWLLLPIVLTVVGLVVGVSLIFTDLLILGVALSVLGSVVGFVALLVFLIQPGNPHPNQCMVRTRYDDVRRPRGSSRRASLCLIATSGRL